MALIWVAHITAYDSSLPGERTLYFASSNYVSGATNYPTGGAAHTYYEPRIKQPAIMQSNIFSSRATYGASNVSYGALELVNPDGELDYMADYSYDGRAITLLLGEYLQGDAAPTWYKVLTGTIEQAEVSWDRITLRLRDNQALLDKPISVNAYGGTNVLPAGLDGVTEDLMGKNKPILLGKVFNISPPIVNTSRLIYQVNDGAINTVSAVYDRGASITKGTDYTDQSDMENNAPTAGYYRVWPAGGYFRLGATPTGTVTCDCVQGAASSDRTVAQLLKYVANTGAGITFGSTSNADVAALDILNNSEVGTWIAPAEVIKNTKTISTTYRSVMDELANSIGAWYGFDRNGYLRMGRLSAPSGSPIITLIPADIITINRIATNDSGRGVATWKVTLNYKKNFTTQNSSDLAGSVPLATQAQLKLATQSVIVLDVSVKTAHLLASDIIFDTLLIDPTAATNEADRRLSLYKTDRVMYELRVAMDSSIISSINLGDTITIQIPRYGMTTGKNFVVVGMKPNLQLKLVDLTVWG